MAKFRFPGKALKLNTRKRVRFRGRYPNNTPEELYTRRIRRGLDLFHKLFGDSDEDEDEFEGFTNGMCKEKKAVPTPKPKAPEKKVEEVCSSLEKEGLVRRTRTSAVAMAVKEVRESKEKKAQALDERTRVKTPPSDIRDKEGVTSEKGVHESTVVAVPNVVVPPGRRKRVMGHGAHKQTNCRVGRQPTVKTALAKKLLAKAKKKLPSLPVVGEKSPKRFILPTMSARSSRIIKPNKRLFADITEMCSTSSSVELQANAEAAESKNSLSLSSKRLVKLRKTRSHSTRLFRSHGAGTVKGSEGGGRDRMRRTISLYTEAITGPCRGQVGRPPKRLLRRVEAPQQEVVEDMPESPQKCALKESRVKEKIEKLLRSPWDDRLKQTGKGGKCEGDEMMPAPTSTTSPALSAISRNILRKARLNLNKSTLLKIRNPDSLQRLIPQSDEGKVEGKCIICDRDEGENTRKFGVTICEMCCSFISSASDGPKEIFECLDSKGSCQIQGVEEEERCLACWLGRILQTCFMANILHDRLRKRLPPPLKEKIPTSLARCMTLGTAAAVTEKDAELNSHTKRLPLDPGGAGGGGGVGGAFGNVMDLPGGWRRKTGSEVVVISPSGEKFKSMQKLEEYLKNQGICADARVLFGNSSSVVEKTVEVKSRPTPSTKSNKRGRVVMTTLPGGWTRRIKWRSAGDRFDTYVFSPDGRTFRSKRELSAHFQAIGKIDDIHKYFPVVNGNSDSSTPSSSDNTGSSSTEPVSSSEIGSDMSSDDKSPEASEVEFETPKIVAPKVNSKTSKVKIKSSKLKSGGDGPESLKVIDSKLDSPKAGGTNASPGEKVLKRYSDKSSQPATDDDEGLRRSSSRLSEKADVSEEVLSDLRTNDPENHKTERKHKKTKGSRTRSLSLTSKQRDNNPTDTTESESEQRATEETYFTKAFGDDRCKTTSSVSEIESPEKRGLCSAWNTILCDSAGEDDFESYASKKLEERRRSTKPLNRKRKNTVEESDHFAVPNLVSDTKANTDKVVLKISKNSLTPLEESTKNRAREGPVSGVLEQEEETSGVVSQASTAESPTPPLVRKKSLSCEEEEQDYGTEDESHDSTTESLISPLAKKGPSSSIKSIISRAKIRPKLKKKTSMYESVQFGNNWSRKIKWNEKGEGKVALLHSPDGQTIRSRIELLAYFKKAGVTKVDLNYYFPPNLKRSVSPVGSNSVGDATTLSVATLGSGHSSEMSDISDSESALKTSEDSSASMDDGSRRRRRVISDYSRLGRTLDVSSSLIDAAGRVPHFARSGKKIIVVTGKSGKIPIIKNEADEPPVVLPEPGGPRVKHVCRSQAQVLKGIQRAVFPSPEKDGKQELDSLSPIIENKKKRKREVVTIVQKAASGKILQKTMWCNKCTGCNTPNCRKCVNCLDMKKFGGPGTKKKPCIKRKCLNPRLSAKSAQSATVQDRKFKRTLPLSITSEPKETKDRPRSPVEPEEKSLSKPDIVEEKVDIVIKVSTQDKSSVFVPRLVTRVQPDQKDRCDIAAGKKFVPGALVNIDYWQGYDVDEMLLSGFSVTTSSPLYPQTLCFRCGSAGKERLTFCIWCCEGVHPFCMEDGEGPESDTEEMLWICRRCAVCHVCGAPGADSLLRCSDCRNYYHMECLGPSAHSTCQPSPDRPWEAEMMIHLRHSWPHQAVLYDAQNCGETGLTDAVVMLTELDVLRDEEVFDDDFDEADIHFLPLGDDQEKQTAKELRPGEDFDLDDAICLEDSIIEVFRNIDLYEPQPSLTSNLHGKELLTLATADEYLCLGYKKLIDYASKKVEISYFRLLQIIHNELFDTLGCPTWRDMLRKGLVEEKPCPLREDSETDTASEGESESEESDWDWEDVLEFRRFEATQEMQEREERRLEKERKEKERDRLLRLARKKELEKEGKSKEAGPGQKPKNVIIVKKKKRRGRPPGVLNKPRDTTFDFIVPVDDFDKAPSIDNQETPKRIRLRQPKTWEEFDRLFLINSAKKCKIKTEDQKDDEEFMRELWAQNIKEKNKKPRVLFSTSKTSEKVKRKKKIDKGKFNSQGGVKPSSKMLKKLKGASLKKKSKNLKVFKGKYKKLLKSQDKSGIVLKKGSLKNKVTCTGSSVLSKRKISTYKDKQDQPIKRRKKESTLQNKFNHHLKRPKGKLNDSEENVEILNNVEGIDISDKEDSDDESEDLKSISRAIQKMEYDKKGQGEIGSNASSTGIKNRKKNFAIFTKTKGPNEDDSRLKKIFRNTKQESSKGDDFPDEPQVFSELEDALVEDMFETDFDDNGGDSECLTDEDEIDLKSDSASVKSEQKEFSVPASTEKSCNSLSKSSSSGKPEEENSDKENLPRVRKLDKTLEEEGTTNLWNGVSDEALVVDAGSTDAKGGGNNEDEDARSEGASEKKRKFETFLEESLAKGDFGPKDKISKKGGSAVVDHKGEEETPSCSGSLVAGRRRRSVGRASLLASQRKAMMDY